MDIYHQEPYYAVTAWVYFMANQWCEEVAVEIFGKVMGSHFWHKWCSGNDHPDVSTMHLYYDMSSEYRKKLVDYAMDYYVNKCRNKEWIKGQ